MTSKNFLYNSLEAVPRSKGGNSYQLKMMEENGENHNVDSLINVDNCGFYLKGRNSVAKPLGIYLRERDRNILVKFSEIKRHLSPNFFLKFGKMKKSITISTIGVESTNQPLMTFTLCI